jgi:hypothetical protein
LTGPFLELNTSGGRWDVKRKIRQEFRCGLTSVVALCGSSGQCRWVDYSVPGNILYGYTAASVGVSKELSKIAGGYLEIEAGTADPEDWENWWEDPYDTAAVEFGYYLYEQYEDDVNESEFRSALTTPVLESFQPPDEGFAEPWPARAQKNTYPADWFDWRVVPDRTRRPYPVE